MGNLLIIKTKWGEKYPQTVQPWVDKWALLSPFFNYPPAVRKVMYTTNAVEGYHRQLRKVTKRKGPFTSDVALQKLVYLTVQNPESKWATTTHNWKSVLNELSLIFEDRIKPHRFD